MKKYVNGVITEMTQEEIEAMKSEKIEMLPTDTERLEALESAFMELVGVIVNG